MSLYSFLTNNCIINNLVIALKLDYKKELASGQWKAFKYNAERSIQQNAGFSHTPEVEVAIKKVKDELVNCLNQHVPKGSRVLDFGCGPGIYMKLLEKDYSVNGIDISEGMLEAAHHELPNAKFYHGNFLTVQFEETYKAIYSISVLEYVPVSQIENFFKKCAAMLETGGVIFIQYPHALRKMDLYYPDRNYINYSPELIDKVASKYFKVIKHEQSFDGRPVCDFDKKPYPTESKTFKNGYLLIAQKL